VTIGTISPAESAVRNSTWGVMEKIHDACSEMTMSLRKNFATSK